MFIQRMSWNGYRLVLLTLFGVVDDPVGTDYDKGFRTTPRKPDIILQFVLLHLRGCVGGVCARYSINYRPIFSNNES
jgi:hypothetical protein